MNDLETAKRLYYSGHYTKAEELLRKSVNDGLRNMEIFKYLGLTEIFLGDSEGGRRSLERTRKVLDSDTEVLNALAYLSLKDGDLQSAVDLWLNILEKNPSFRTARRNLDRVRNAKDTGRLVQRASPRQYLGAAGLTVRMKPVLIAGSAGVAVFLAVLAVVNLTGQPDHTGRRGMTVASADLPKTDDYIVTSADSLYRFENREIRPLFSLCKKYIRRNSVNSAVVLINKVLHSNLKDDVKQRFLGLKEFMSEPSDYRSVRSHVRFSELFNDPTVNDGVYLVLSGRVRQIKSDFSGTEFLMNCSDDTGENAEISVASSAHFEGLKNGVPVTVLARFKSVVSLKGRIRTEGLKIWMEKKLLTEMRGR